MKQVLVLDANGNPAKKEIIASVDRIAERLARSKHNVRYINISEKNIRDCIGCFACWIKTPGRCVLKDDVKELLRTMVHSDFILFVSDIELSHYSPAFYGILNRMMPLSTAYLKILDDGRTVHESRYGNLGIKFGFLLEGAPCMTAEEVKRQEEYWSQADAIHFHGLWLAGKNEDEVVREIDNC